MTTSDQSPDLPPGIPGPPDASRAAPPAAAPPAQSADGTPAQAAGSPPGGSAQQPGGSARQPGGSLGQRPPGRAQQPGGAAYPSAYPHPGAGPGDRPGPGGPGRTRPAKPGGFARIRPVAPLPVSGATLGAVLATGVLSALLLGDGLGINLLLVALPAAVAAWLEARRAGRRARAWTLTWAVGGLALLAVPALLDAGWPTFLAVVSAAALGSLALHGNRSWLGVIAGSLGIVDAVVPAVGWGWRGIRGRLTGSRARWGSVFRTVAVAVVLLLVFGTLFASADAAFADLLGDVLPDVSLAEGPWRIFLLGLGLAGALAAAHTAAAPAHWDRITVRPGRARGRVEWALPLIVLDVLFAAFIALQLVVLLGGYDRVLRETGLKPAEYAREGFWQLLWATLLTLLVVALALRMAPRGGARDRLLVKGVLGTLCVLTLVVVASALRRMDLYVDAFGLTRLRISVAAVELWLGVVLLLIVAAGILGARHLPRAVAVSAAVGVLAFGLMSPDRLIAEQNVQRYREGKAIDISYLQELSADAVPALDTIPDERMRACALREIQSALRRSDTPWYAMSLSEARARDILAERPAPSTATPCYPLDDSVDRDSVDPDFGDRDFPEPDPSDPEYDPYDPY
ncbi:DUF4173 domain-containing protein [Streptomyces sp. NBC_01218]|uniref:DUF4153 domain-containing protein n=1 Tax=unclassified Streptomyces TaxID=2593676 RepID=UPI002E13A5F3|nr:DUF4173 domain-containing protein [Streptomyces sp. NBC_01218]